jgi:WS/DGAT/MGAT family acyltransferase
MHRAVGWSRFMASYKYDLLSAQDNSFLLMETSNLPMHVATTQIFAAGPLAKPGGGIDFASITRFTESVLHRIPRYRQVLSYIPFENRPVWIDDDHFHIDYHIRHSALPRPGSEAQLKRMASRIQATPLDRNRPLWEIWVVEGLEGDRFAIISKIHHCMIDGSSGVDIGQILQSPSPEAVIHEPAPYLPRAAPTSRELFTDSWSRRLGAPFRAARGLSDFRRESENVGEEIAIRAAAIRASVSAQSAGSSDTPINGTLGPHRSFEWLRMPLADIKALRRGLGCTVNDVVLTILTGAFRDYMQHRGVPLRGIEFKAQTPVSVRSNDERGDLGNRVSGWLVPLPLEEADPKLQLKQIHATTQELKDSRQALGADLMIQAMGSMPTALFSLGVQAVSGSMNTIVTNVPGPQFPLYILGAELLDLFPMVPLLPNIGLGVALMSYNGKVCWGFIADPELVPDLDAHGEGVVRARRRRGRRQATRAQRLGLAGGRLLTRGGARCGLPAVERLHQQLHHLLRRLDARLLDRILQAFEAQQVELRVGLTHPGRQQPEPLQIRHDLREEHLPEAAHERRLLHPRNPHVEIEAEPLEYRCHQQPLAHQVGGFNHKLFALAQLVLAHLVAVEIPETQHAERHVT